MSIITDGDKALGNKIYNCGNQNSGVHGVVVDICVNSINLRTGETEFQKLVFLILDHFFRKLKDSLSPKTSLFRIGQVNFLNKVQRIFGSRNIVSHTPDDGTHILGEAHFLNPDGVRLDKVFPFIGPDIDDDISNCNTLFQSEVASVVQSVLEVRGKGTKNLVHHTHDNKLCAGASASRLSSLKSAAFLVQAKVLKRKSASLVTSFDF